MCEDQGALAVCLEGGWGQEGAIPSQDGLRLSGTFRRECYEGLVGGPAQAEGPPVDVQDLHFPTADGACAKFHLAALPGAQLDVHRVGVLCLDEVLHLKAGIEARFLEAGEEALLGEGSAQQAHDEGPVGPLLDVGMGVGTLAVKGEACPAGCLAQQVPGQRRDVVGPGGMGAGRPPHHGAENLVEDAGCFHGVPLEGWVQRGMPRASQHSGGWKRQRQPAQLARWKVMRPGQGTRSR